MPGAQASKAAADVMLLRTEYLILRSPYQVRGSRKSVGNKYASWDIVAENNTTETKGNEEQQMSDIQVGCRLATDWLGEGQTSCSCGS